MWIDHLTKSLHWAKTNDKRSIHKALKLEGILKIGTAPRTTLESLSDEFYGKNPSEARFDRPDNSIRLYLSGYDTHKDIHLPVGISDADREDWITILLDCCGFKNWEAASNGRTYEDIKVREGQRDLHIRRRSLGGITLSPRGTPNTPSSTGLPFKVMRMPGMPPAKDSSNNASLGSMGSLTLVPEGENTFNYYS